MKRFTKRADQLNPGDVLLGLTGFDLPLVPAMVLLVENDDLGSVSITFEGGATTQAAWVGMTECDVLVDVYSAAQLNADELAANLAWMLRWCETYARSSMGPSTPEFNKARGLVERTKPAPPPTIGEVLSALDGIDPDHMPPSSRAVLDRARRAGMLP